ncbi:hypothetical protein Ancab_005715 [Ancistrocladus abbreviatus]
MSGWSRGSGGDGSSKLDYFDFISNDLYELDKDYGPYGNYDHPNESQQSAYEVEALDVDYESYAEPKPQPYSGYSTHIGVVGYESTLTPRHFRQNRPRYGWKSQYGYDSVCLNDGSRKSECDGPRSNNRSSKCESDSTGLDY